MNARIFLVILLAALFLIPSSSAAPNIGVSYTVQDYVMVPSQSDVGNLTGLFLTHDVTFKSAELETPNGTLVIGFGEAKRNRNGSYGFAFLFTYFYRDSDLFARITNVTQVIVEDRGGTTSRHVQSYFYSDGQYVRSPSSAKTQRVYTGNFTFFRDMRLRPHQNVTSSSITKIYIFVPFYTVSPQAKSVHVELYITLSVGDHEYYKVFSNDLEVYHPEYEVRLGSKQTTEANVTIGERVLFRIVVNDPPALVLGLADEYATIATVTLPNMYYPVPINASYPLPPPAGASGGLVGRPLANQAAYDPENHTLAIAFPVTAQVEKKSFEIYIFYPKAYRVYVDPITYEVKTGAVRSVITLTLHSVSHYRERLNLVAVTFVVILALIVVVTTRILVRTMRR